MEKISWIESERLHNRDKSVIPGGLHFNFASKLTSVPLYFEKGFGTRLVDVDHNEYLDFYGKFGAMIFGHRHAEYLDSIFSEFTGTITDNNLFDHEISQSIIDCVPSAELVRYGLSGTEIVQTALRVSRAYNKKNKFIRFEGHYHGSSDNIMGGRLLSKEHPIPVEFVGDFRGTAGRAHGILESQSYLLPWNNMDLLEKVTDKYENEISAIIMEPICINGGGIFPGKDFLESVRDLCNRKNIVLIFDEIISGFRIGIGGAQQLFNVIPDLTTLGKAVSGGAFPVSILAGKSDIMKLIAEFQVSHAGTHNGYQLGLLAVRSAIKLLRNNIPNYFEHMIHYGELIKNILLQESQRVGIDMQIMGHPNAMFLHISKSPILEFGDISHHIREKSDVLRRVFLENGIILSPSSRIYLNTSINENDLDFLEGKAKIALPIVKRALQH